MKKFIASLAVLFLCLLAVPTQTANAAAKLNQTKATVYVGNQTTLKVKGTSKKVTWKTSNKKVATVKNGKVTAKKKGTAVITAKVGSKKYTCKVTVKNQELNKTKVTLTAGNSTKLKVNGAYKKVTWKTSNSKVATVSKSGKVKAVAAGTAKVTAKHNGKTYTCKVTVKKAPVSTVVVKVDKVIINDKEMAFTTQKYLKKLEIKSQKSDSKYVYYTVTKTSYTNLMNGIKKDLDTQIAALVKSQSLINKVTYNSKCTEFNVYIDINKAGELDNMSDLMTDDVMGPLESMAVSVSYYQAFSGTLADNMKLKLNLYDSVSKVLIYSEEL